MSQSHVLAALRGKVAAQARYRCGYSGTSETIAGTPMEVDHLVPESRGGSTTEDNLWLACSPCNRHKGHRTTAEDPASGQIVALFNPRLQVWAEHFSWVDSGARIAGLTATGRATVQALRLNRPVLAMARQKWIEAGWHPPRES